MLPAPDTGTGRVHGTVRKKVDVNEYSLVPGPLTLGAVGLLAPPIITNMTGFGTGKMELGEEPRNRVK